MDKTFGTLLESLKATIHSSMNTFQTDLNSLRSSIDTIKEEIGMSKDDDFKKHIMSLLKN